MKNIIIPLTICATLSFGGHSQALVYNSSTTPVLNGDGTCLSFGGTSFDMTFNITPDINDGGGNEFFQLILVDSNDVVLSAYQKTQAVGGAVNVSETFPIETAPTGGPFRIILRDSTVTVPPLPFAGDILAGPTLHIEEFNPGLLDSDCPGASAAAGPTGDSAPSASTVRASSAAAASISTSAINETTGFITDRIGAVLAGAGGAVGGRGRLPDITAPPEEDFADGPAQTGAGGSGEANPIGVWADLSWTGYENTNAAARARFRSIAGVVGVDTLVAPDFLLGGIASYSRGRVETPGETFRQVENGILFGFYSAYAVDDIFSIDVSAAYGLGENAIETNQGASEADATTHRYFVTMNTSGRKYWDQFGLFGRLGVLWGESFQEGYTLDNGGGAIGSARSRLGSLRAALQPSYVFAVDDVLIEPYLRGEYAYDFTKTEIAGAPNDRDAMTLGGGLNIFADAISGTLEGQRMLGREDEKRTTISGNVRINF